MPHQTRPQASPIALCLGTRPRIVSERGRVTRPGGAAPLAPRFVRSEVLMIRRCLASVFLALVCVVTAGAQSPSSAVTTDSPTYAEVLAIAYPAHQPGAAALVARRGAVEFLTDLAISLVDDRLMIQATGQQMVELHAASETEFFLNEVDAQIEFVQGADGHVTELILRQGGRRQLA